MTQEKAFLNAKEVAALLGCSLKRSYEVIAILNKELAAAGKLVINYRINKRYLEKKISVEDL